MSEPEVDTRAVLYSLDKRDEKIGAILVIILRGTQRKEFKEEEDGLLLRREQLGLVCEPDGRRAILELLQLLELLFICAPCMKPATEREPGLAPQIDDGLPPNT